MKATRAYVMRARAESAESTRQRVLESAVEELWRHPVSQVRLEIVATRANVSVQTVLRIFGSRSSLLDSALEPLRDRIILVREAAQPGDVESTISALFDHYEEMGDFVIHNLAEEQDLPELLVWLKQGREVHRQSLQRQFAPQLRGRRDKKLVLDCLVVACDVYTWKVLRRDAGRSRKAAEACVCHMVNRILEGEMTRFAFVTWDGGGNVPPAVGIAQELASRGHDVVFVGYEVQRNGFDGKGLKFISLRRSGQFDIYGAVSPSERIAGLMTNVWASAEHLADVPDALEATGADVVVVDFSMQGALAAAHQLDSPVAVLAHSSIAGLIPPPASPMGAARLTATNSLRQGAGLPLLSRLNEGWSGLQTLVTTIPALDPAADGAESCVHYVGPVFENFAGESWVSPWGPDDNRPLVLVSFSTTGLWDQRGRIRNTLEALAGEPVRVLVSAPQRADIAPLPDNAAIRGFVPHSLVLPGAAATVTHAGHGTVSASLAHGVPIVALPNPVADQPFLAARLQELGAGIGLPGESGPEDIRMAVREVMRNVAFATTAKDLAAEIRAAPGAAGAALELEQLASAGRPAPR